MNKTKKTKFGTIISLDTITARALKTPTENNVEKCLKNNETAVFKDGKLSIVIDGVLYELGYDKPTKEYVLHSEKSKPFKVFLPTSFQGVRLTEKAEKELLALEKGASYPFRYKEVDYIIRWSEKHNDYIALTTNGEIVDITEN